MVYFGAIVTNAVHHHWFYGGYSEKTDLRLIKYVFHNFVKPLPILRHYWRFSAAGNCKYITRRPWRNRIDSNQNINLPQDSLLPTKYRREPGTWHSSRYAVRYECWHDVCLMFFCSVVEILKLFNHQSEELKLEYGVAKTPEHCSYCYLGLCQKASTIYKKKTHR